MIAGAPVASVETRLDRGCDALFLLGVLGTIAFVLWLPLFPTGDGPVHLYYADVLRGLLRHDPAYAQDYAVRHLFAPYLLHYLALISLEHLVKPAMAEKLFIAAIFVVQASGFRFLARTLGAHAGLLSVWMLPLLFSWSLGGGFLNCCFATGVALWAYGVWVRLGEEDRYRTADGRSRGRARAAALLAAYAGLLAVLVLSHPVPLLVLLLFTAADLGLCGLEESLAGEPGERRWRRFAPQLVALLLSGAAFVAPVMLAQKGQAAAVLPGIGFHADVLSELFAGGRLGLFSNAGFSTVRDWVALLCRVALVMIVPGVILLLSGPSPAAAGPLAQTGADATESGKAVRRDAALSGLRGTLPRSAATRLLSISVVFLVCSVFFPRSLNHSYFFPQRLWDIVWLLVLGCGAAARLSAQAQRRLAAWGLALVVLTAASGLPALTRIARAEEQLAAAPLPAGKRGVFLEPASAVEGRSPLTYPVYFWSGARAFAASRSVLLNSPWLGLTILPIRDAGGAGGPQALLDRGLPSFYSESPLILTRTIAAPAEEAVKLREAGQVADTPADRAAILARSDFLLYSNPASLGSTNSAETTRAEAEALLGADAAGWRCDGRAFYSVCVHVR